MGRGQVIKLMQAISRIKMQHKKIYFDASELLYFGLSVKFFGIFQHHVDIFNCFIAKPGHFFQKS
jgi:hypothetical protein